MSDPTPDMTSSTDTSTSETFRIPSPEDAEDQTKVIPGAAAASSAGADELEESEALAAFERRRKEQKRKKRRHLAIGLIVAAAALLAIFLPSFLSSMDTEPTLPPTATVYRGSLTSTVSVSGTTQPISSTVVTPEVDGIIQDVRVSEGDSVQAGDVLFTIRNDSLDRAVADAQQQVASAQRALDSAKAASDQAYASYKKALTAWNSATTAEEQSAMQDPDELYYSSVVSAKDSVESARIALEQAQQNLADAQATAQKRTVTAPVSGSIVAVGAQEGASTQASAQDGTPLLQIADLSQMRVTTQVNELDISSLAIGQSAQVTFMALPDVTLDATVERIATVSSGDDMYGTGSATYKVTLIIPEPDPKLKPGMTADATITTQDVPDSLIVPLAAITDDGEKTTVTVVTLDDRGQIESSEIRNVEVIAKNGSEAAITGVEEGEIVDLSGSSDEVLTGDGTGSSVSVGSSAVQEG